jgi:PII-like signaling protein
MSPARQAEILRIHVSECDRWKGAPLHEAIVARCRELKIAGATVFFGVEGYGETAGVHRSHLVGSDCPVVIVVVDVPENIARLIPAIEEMIPTGLLARSPAEMIRVEKSKTTSHLP